MSAFRNASGISSMITLVFSNELMDDVIMMLFPITVGDAMYSFLIHCHCLLPFAHSLLFTCPHLFSIINIKDANACFLWLCISLWAWMGINVIMSCNCCSSNVTDCFPWSPNSLILLFILYWVARITHQHVHYHVILNQAVLLLVCL